jgi:hypothetical protein
MGGCCVELTGAAVVAGVDVDATLFGGLGSDGKNASPFGITVAPLAGNVGDPN